jgi:hypothetical protein
MTAAISQKTLAHPKMGAFGRHLQAVHPFTLGHADLRDVRRRGPTLEFSLGMADHVSITHCPAAKAEQLEDASRLPFHGALRSGPHLGW